MASPDALKATAKEFAAKNQLENVALVVPQENENGPEEFNDQPGGRSDRDDLSQRQGGCQPRRGSRRFDRCGRSRAIIADTAKILK